MNELTQSKIEFFHSESSFSSSSLLSSSRLDYPTQQLLADCQQIFAALKSVLLPRDDLLPQGHLEQIVRRARILYNDTIPQFLRHVGSEDKGYRGRLDQEARQLADMLGCYERYQHGDLPYEQFYRLYGAREKEFRKGRAPEGDYLAIQPQVVTIVQEPPRRVTAVGAWKNGDSHRSTNNHQREILQLQEQIVKLNKRQKTLVLQHESSQRTLQLQTNSRISNILALTTQPDQPLRTLRLQLQQTLAQNTHYMQQVNTLTAQVQALQLELQEQSLRSQGYQVELEGYRRVGNSSRVSEMGLDNGTRSEVGEVGQDRRLRNLEHENAMLRAELSRERERGYRIKRRQAAEEESELTRLRKNLQAKSKQLLQTRLQLDRHKVQVIRLYDQLHHSRKTAELTKLTQLQSTMPLASPLYAKSHQDFNTALSPSLNQSRTSKLSISTYIGDGNQHYPYYQLIGKQFRVRFKRACLKEKQLLHKGNGIEIGVISEYVEGPEIRVYLHLANCGEQEKIRNLRMKVLNSKNNKVTIEKTSIETIDIGQQVKNLVTATIKAYPLGCTALICQYEYFGKTEQIRILLPVHIFKMLTIKPRDDQFRSPSRLALPSQRKISRDMSTLGTYFKGATIAKDRIQACLLHAPTETKLLCDLYLQGSEVVLEWQHRSGEENVSEYVVRTLGFLLRKEPSI